MTSSAALAPAPAIGTAATVVPPAPRALPRRRRALRRGVTLVEVLIVVAIMALISGGVAFFVLPKYRQAQRDTCTTTARTIRQAASMWRSLKGGPGECPTVSKLIEDKEIDPSSTTADPWGTPFVVTCTDDDVTVASAGPDAKTGTKDDVVVGPQGTTSGSEE